MRMRAVLLAAATAAAFGAVQPASAWTCYTSAPAALQVCHQQRPSSTPEACTHEPVEVCPISGVDVCVWRTDGSQVLCAPIEWGHDRLPPLG